MPIGNVLHLLIVISLPSKIILTVSNAMQVPKMSRILADLIDQSILLREILLKLLFVQKMQAMA